MTTDRKRFIIEFGACSCTLEGYDLSAEDMQSLTAFLRALAGDQMATARVSRQNAAQSQAVGESTMSPLRRRQPADLRGQTDDMLGGLADPTSPQAARMVSTERTAAFVRARSLAKQAERATRGPQSLGPAAPDMPRPAQADTPTDHALAAKIDRIRSALSRHADHAAQPSRSGRTSARAPGVKPMDIAAPRSSGGTGEYTARDTHKRLPVIDTETGDSVSRLLQKAEDELREPAGRTRRATISQLRAAAAARIADFTTSRPSKPTDDVAAYRRDLAKTVVGQDQKAQPGPAGQDRVKPLKLAPKQRIHK